MFFGVLQSNNFGSYLSFNLNTNLTFKGSCLVLLSLKQRKLIFLDASYHLDIRVLTRIINCIFPFSQTYYFEKNWIVFARSQWTTVLFGNKNILFILGVAFRYKLSLSLRLTISFFPHLNHPILLSEVSLFQCPRWESIFRKTFWFFICPFWIISTDISTQLA